MYPPTPLVCISSPGPDYIPLQNEVAVQRNRSAGNPSHVRSAIPATIDVTNTNATEEAMEPTLGGGAHMRGSIEGPESHASAVPGMFNATENCTVLPGTELHFMTLGDWGWNTSIKLKLAQLFGICPPLLHCL